MRTRLAAVLILVALVEAPAMAGPPYETDDPVPTDLGAWEIYTFGAIDGHHGEIDGAAGVDLNYGPVEGLQLTATLPVGFADRAGQPGWQAGAGEVELGVKYRFLHLAKAGVSAAIFPRVILPTGSNGLGGARARLLLPLWVGKDVGPWSIFGGGGYEINSGAGNRDFWQGGIALTLTILDRWSLGGEVTHQGPDSVGASPTTSLGLGSIVKLSGPFALLISGGPRFARDQTSYHLYAALGLSF